MTVLKRGMVVEINLDSTLGSETGKVRPCVIVTNDVYNKRLPVIQVAPITAWNEKKGRSRTNIEILPVHENGLTKRSVVDCLQTRPVDHRLRLVSVLGELTREEMGQTEDEIHPSQCSLPLHCRCGILCTYLRCKHISDIQ